MSRDEQRVNSVRWRSGWVVLPYEVFSQNCPPLMVFPAAEDFQIAPRKTLADEAALSREGNGGLVPRLDIGFQAVELQFAESMTEYELHTFVHQSSACVRQKAVIPEKSILERPTNHVVHIDDPNKLTGLAVDDQKTSMRSRQGSLHIIGKCLWGGRR